MSGIVWLDGAYLDAVEARIPAMSRAVLWGEGLFETLRVHAGRPLGYAEHVARLAASAVALDIGARGALEGLEGVIAELAARSSMPESVARLSVLAGVGETAHVLVALRPLPPGLERDRTEGIEAATHRAGSLPLAAHKTTSYLRCLAASRATRATGATETLLVDDSDHVLEGSRTSVFALLGGVLVTPPLDGRILPGLARRAVLSIAPSVGLKTAERSLALAELREAGAVAVTNSVIGVVPVRSLDGQAVGGEPAALASIRRLGAALEERMLG